MTNLQLQTQSDLLVYIKENLMGDKNLSTRGVERLCEISNNKLIKGEAFASEKLGQKLTEHGFEAVALTLSGWNAQSVWLAIEYYAYDSKAKAPGAKQLARTFGQIGIMTTFEKLSDSVKQKVKQTENLPLTPHFKLEVMNSIKETLKDETLPAHMRQIMTDDLFNSVFFTDNLLPSIEEPLWLGAVQRAEELGFKTDRSSRVRLGQHLAKLDLDKRKESRLCNGSMRNINVYRVDEKLDSAIVNFLG